MTIQSGSALRTCSRMPGSSSADVKPVRSLTPIPVPGEDLRISRSVSRIHSGFRSWAPPAPLRRTVLLEHAQLSSTPITPSSPESIFVVLARCSRYVPMIWAMIGRGRKYIRRSSSLTARGVLWEIRMKGVIHEERRSNSIIVRQKSAVMIPSIGPGSMREGMDFPPGRGTGWRSFFN